MNRIHYTHCPLCESPVFEFFIQAKDYTVSKEKYAIQKCTICGLKFTQDIPDAQGIGQYYESEDYISHSDTKTGWMNKAYHFARNYMLRSKADLVKRFTAKQKGQLLDIGAGTGYFLNEMQCRGWQVKGIEVNEQARAFAQGNFQLNLQSDEALKNFKPGQFDVITLWHVLEHLHDLSAYFNQIKSLLKPDGTLLIAVPNADAHDAVHYKEHWAAWDVPRHLYHFSPAAMQFLAESFGMQIIKKRLMPFDPFYISLLSEQYKHGAKKPLRSLIKGSWYLLKSWFNVNRASSVIYILRHRQ